MGGTLCSVSSENKGKVQLKILVVLTTKARPPPPPGRLVREELFENESIRGEKWTGKLETRRNSIREMGEKWETIRNSRREMGVNGIQNDTRNIIFQR